MRFLKTLFWVTIIVSLVVFATNNWVPVTIRLWGDLLLDTKLPALVVGSLLIGFLPLYIWHRGTHWRMRRRIMTLESSSQSKPIDMRATTPNSAAPSSVLERAT